ncbi:MAG: oligosaccharide flippase family protein, partial [bacterium]|nr:oligosaccharide flippase family protein [bacterium]
EYLHIPTPLYYLVLSLSYLLIFPQAICYGVLQGWQLFGWFAFVGAFGTLIKLFAGAGAAWAGLGVAGVLGALFLSYLIPYLLSLRPIFRLGSRNDLTKERFDWRSPLVYSLPVFLTMLGLTLFMTTDMIIVKRFFPPYEAGIYSALSLLGKTVLWISTSIVQVMFALVAEKKAANKDDSGYFLASLFLVGFFCVLVSTVFSIFPSQVVRLSFGPRYLDAGSYLAFYCLFITLYSLINVFANYFLSCGKTVAASLVLVGALIQLGMLGIFHRSFVEVISVSSLVCLVLLVVMIGAYLFSERMHRVYPLGQT